MFDQKFFLNIPSPNIVWNVKDYAFLKMNKIAPKYYYKYLIFELTQTV